MPGGPPWGSVEAINAQTWYQQQQAAAAWAAQQAVPPPQISELTPAERERQAAERERARRELQEREAAERHAHDMRVIEREQRLGWPTA